MKMKGVKKANGFIGPVTDTHFGINLIHEKRVSYNKEGKHTVCSIAHSLFQICLCWNNDQYPVQIFQCDAAFLHFPGAGGLQDPPQHCAAPAAVTEWQGFITREWVSVILALRNSWEAISWLQRQVGKWEYTVRDAQASEHLAGAATWQSGHTQLLLCSGTFRNTMVSPEGPSCCQMLFAWVQWMPES